MVHSPSSSAQQARQALADRLTELCRDAGLTGLDLARRCGWSGSKSSRIMNARTAPTAEDIRAWCKACGCEEQAADLVASLRTAEGMWVGWRRMERAGLKRAQEARLPLYVRTRRFRSYSSWLVPGMIQTQPYTTAALRALQRRRGLAVDDVTEAVAARLERQRVLHEGGRQFAFLVEESVLRAGIGGTEVMSGQLRHLMTVASLPHVSLGVVPMTPDRERWPAEGFWIYDATQVNVELISGYLTIRQPGEVAMYAAAFAELAELAAYGAAAQDKIAAALAALR
ncbi:MULTISPECIES: helix-turn-helix domain-containing protein [unclassified Streptomyces]|uniref:helix-turn-helix domain-containing protein n=1 Tax=unclassified Streptomyces TaxID=2593676 RepID=UPI0004758755|nr:MULTISPECIES: helix-turn-helix transcriptional regulator [unclassified Streptomyces]MYQ81239.1 helix-turn-helix domain-containing protein [Streptomyces sp. SID4923]